eukprot:Seg2342.1 transcript_id=Seg2342.1/GoldUCD/mRNA.D3Y31 product="Protein phosphatase Slingshot 1" protein_id=Seg2342.1/GoldUCD/D3Y31
MALLTVERSQSVEGFLSSASDDDDESDDQKDDFQVEDIQSSGPRPPKLGRMRSPSFAGFFASKGGAVSLPDGIKARTATPPHSKSCGELQFHLQAMTTMLREEDMLKMAVRIESQLPDKKRYLTAVTSPNYGNLLIGIDWVDGPTIGLVLELYSSTIAKLDGDGGFHVSYDSERTHCFKPISVQTLWSAMHVIQRGIEMAARYGHDSAAYKEFLSFYRNQITSDPTSISEWNMMDDLLSTRQFDMVLTDQEESEQAVVKKLLRSKLKEVLIRVDLDEITSRQIRVMCEEELGIDLSEFKSELDTEMFTILGQMDSASKIFDYLYLGSEWNASDLEELNRLGVGYILNLTREIDNFFPDTFQYYNVRVYDEEETELLQYWDNTYKFINKAKMAGSKVLVHCRRGISRSASSVIAYAMKSRGWSLKESMEYVKNCRSIVDPNAGFQKQLIIYEGILNSSRNRYLALFRQRSKSEQLQPTTREKRKKFQRSKLSSEIDEEEEEIDNNNQDDIGKRPKSWAPETSGINYDDTLARQEMQAPIKVSSKSLEMPALSEDAEDACLPETKTETMTPAAEGAELVSKNIDKEMQDAVDGQPKAVKSKTKKRRPLSRAKTLPCQASMHWEESAESVDSGADQDSGVQSPEEEAKEEGALKQAMSASLNKMRMLESLVNLQKSCDTRTVLDDKFSVESIIKPSSLRKISLSRKLPYQRRNSLSEEADHDRKHKLRKRAMTIGPSKCYLNDDFDDDYDGDGDFDREEGELHNERGEGRSASVEPGVVDSKDSLETTATFADGASVKEADSEAKRGLVSEDKVAAKADQKYEEKESNLEAKTPGHGTMDASADMNKNCDKPTSDSADANVIETSQFKTVKESAQQIEERSHLQRLRSLRSPRRHTIGESKVWADIIESAQPNQPRSKSTEGRVRKRDESPSPANVEEKAGKRQKAARSNLLSVQSLDVEKCKRSSSGSKLQKHRSFSGGEKSEDLDGEGIPIEAYLAGNECGRVERPTALCPLENLNDENEDISVRKLVQKHVELIKHNSPPGTSDSKTSSFAIPDSAASIGEEMVSHSFEKIDQPVGIDVVKSEAHMEASESENVDSNKVASRSDISVVQPGLVKRQSRLFSQTSTSDMEVSPSKEAVTVVDDGNRPTVLDETEGPTTTQQAELETTGETGQRLEPGKDMEEKDASPFARNKRGSVKERLEQIERSHKKTDQPKSPKRPVSLHFDRSDDVLDTEVACIMDQSQTQETDKGTERPDSFLRPCEQALLSKSAPVSPKILRDERSVRSSSMSDMLHAQNVAKCSRDVFLQLSPKETPNEAVRSLVDRFEEGDIVP